MVRSMATDYLHDGVDEILISACLANKRDTEDGRDDMSVFNKAFRATRDALEEQADERRARYQ